jgi:murein DD-endopeptidase MepM/ murein hydrolase activator NlpD
VGRHTENSNADAFASLVEPQKPSESSAPLTRRELRAREEASKPAPTTPATFTPSYAPLATPGVARASEEADTVVVAPVASASRLRRRLGISFGQLRAQKKAISRNATTPLPVLPAEDFEIPRAAPVFAALAAPAPAPSPSPASRGTATSAAVMTAGAQRKRSHVSARLITVTAMAFVAAIAVATSVPANALLTSSDMETLNDQQQQDRVTLLASGQSVDVSGESVIAGRDSVSVSAAPVKAFTSSSSQRVLTFVPNSTGPILWPFPVTVPLTDSFGPRAGLWTYGGYTGNFHSGLDFDPGYGTPIQAIADGIVSEVSSSLCGTAVVIDHNVNGEKFQSEYCHMVSGSPTVTAGQTITAGTIIGNVGATGMATGAHLHLEIHIGGNAVDPYVFLQSRTNASAAP